MALTDTQIQDLFQSKLGRMPTGDELTKYRTSSVDSLSSISTLPKTTGVEARATDYVSSPDANTFVANQDMNIQPTDAMRSTVLPTQTVTPTQPSRTLQAYQGVQSAIADIDRALATSFEDKKKQVIASGGIVNETQLRGMVATEQAPLIAQRRELAAQQSNLGRQYQNELAMSKQEQEQAYKREQLDITKAKLKQAEQKQAEDIGYKYAQLSTRETPEQKLANQMRLAKFTQDLKDMGIGYTTDGEYKNDIDALVGNTYNIIDSKNGKDAFKSSIKSARNDADKISAVATVVLKNSPGAVKEDFINQSVGIQQITKAIQLLDNKVKTGALASGRQYLFNLVGKDYDPNLAAIDGYITAAIQPYRSSITGAAWGDQETAEYNSLFGSTKYEPEELKARLERVKQIMLDKTVTALNSQVSPFSQEPSPFERISNPVNGNLINIKESIVAQESGGDYSAVNKDSGALGKYQIMPDNLPALIGLQNTQENRQKFLNNPELQDQAFDNLFNELNTRYNGDQRKILADYYGGPTAAKLVGTPDGDRFGKFDPKTGKPTGYPSVNEYVNQVINRSSKTSTSTQSGAGSYEDYLKAISQ